ncbi:MAG: hypothetical protein AAF267_12855 [Deinococcota bacterium]
MTTKQTVTRTQRPRDERTQADALKQDVFKQHQRNQLEPKKPLWRRAGSFVNGLELVLTVVLAVIALDIIRRFVLLEATDITFFPLNGSFQTYNPLRRILAGELPGRDFQTYLGLGTTYTMYAVFRLFGSDLAASEAATHLLHASGLGFSTYMLARLAGLRPLVATLASLLALVAGRYSLGFTEFIFYPGNSMLGWRSILIYFTAFGLLQVSRVPQAWLRAVILGATAGLQHLWSNDYGTSSLLVLSLGVPVWLLPCKSVWQFVQRYTTYVIVAVVAFITVAFVLTAGHAWNWLVYNWRDVRHDQFWYFDGDKVYAFADIFVNRDWLVFFVGLMAMCILLLVLGWRRQDARAYALAYLLGTGLVAWLLSTIGGSVSVRYAAPTSLAALGAAVYVLLWLEQLLSKQLRNYRLRSSHRQQAQPSQQSLSQSSQQLLRRWSLIALTAVVPIGYASLLISTPAEPLVSEADLGRHIYVPELGGYVVELYAESAILGRAIASELADTPADARVFSTYSTALDVVAGASNASGHDYIIHALGNERDIYLEAFETANPHYVTTLRESFSWWETWNRRLNWWFYRALLPNYHPVALTAYNIVWAQRAEPLADPHWQLSCVVEPVSDGVTHLNIDTTASSYVDLTPFYVEVDFAYQVDIDDTAVPLIGDRGVLNISERPSAALTKQTIDNAPVVPGTLQRERTVVEHFPGLVSTLRLQVEPAARSQLTVSACEATVIGQAHAQVDGATIDPNVWMPTWERTFEARQWGDLDNQPWLNLMTAVPPSEVTTVADAASPEARVSRPDPVFTIRPNSNLGDLEDAQTLPLEALPNVADVPPLTRYSVTTNQRYSYDVSHLELNASEIDALVIPVRCRFVDRRLPRLGGPMVRLSWEGENTLARDAMMHFRANTGDVFVPLRTAAWHTAGQLESLSIELVYAQNCSIFFAGDVRFYKSREALIRVADLDVPNRPRQDLEELATGYYEVTGSDPGIIYDVSGLGLHTDDVHVLAMSVSCENRNEDVSLLFDVFWRDQQSRFSGDAATQVRARDQRVYIDLFKEASWQGQLQALRIDLARANACERIRVSQLTFYQKFEAGTDILMF